MSNIDRLERLEASLTKSVAGFLSDLRITGKTRQKDNEMTAQNETVAAVLAEMRAKGNMRWAAEIESALTKAEAVPVAWIRYRPDGLWDGPIHSSEFTDYFRKSGKWTPLYAHAPPADPARYFADGPQGSFYTDDPKLARAILDAYDEGQDWTITELGDMAEESPAVPVESLGRDADTKMEGWHAAIDAAAELVGNAPDDRFRRRAEQVERWIENNRPVPPVESPASVPDGCHVVRYNDDGEFGQKVGWLYRTGGGPCVISGKPVYVWRPIAELLETPA